MIKPSKTSVPRLDGAKTLNKELCVRCHDQHRKRKWSRQPPKDRDWERGRIACVYHKNHHYYLKITEEPPIECPYYLEQILTRRGDMKNEQACRIPK